MSVVNHFTSEYLATGTFRGVPAAGFRAQDSENEHLRKYLQLPDGASGCMVYALDPLSGAAGVLQPQDVVTRVDGLPVADDGTVQFRDDERLDVSHVISAKHVGDTLSVAVWRGGRELELRYCLGPPNSLVPMIHGVDCSPQYYIIGGCVFCPLSLPFLEAVLGVKWRSGGPPALLALLAKYRSESGQQVVVLSQVLASDVNFGYQRLSCVRCLTFNGTPLHNLAHLVQLVDGCDSDFMRFGLEGDSVVVLGSKEARDAGPTILRDHAISADRSADLAAATSANAATAAATAAAAGPAAAGSVERPLFGAAAAPAAATTAPDSSIGDTLSNADKPATHGGGGGGGTAQAD